MEHKIYTGTRLNIKKGFWHMPFKIMYCGMSNEMTFVLSPFMNYGHHGFSPNIYYGSTESIIQVLDKKFEVVEVTPGYIILKETNKALNTLFLGEG